MPGDPVAWTKRYHAALNAYDPAIVTPMFADDAVYDSPGVGALEGRDAIIAAFTRYLDEYADQQAVDDEIVAVGDSAARSRWRLIATSRRSGKRLERCGVETITFSSGGLIARVEVRDL